MKHQDVEKYLLEQGLREVSRTKKAIGFSVDGGQAEAYVNTESVSDNNTLIIHPHFANMRDELLEIPGVIPGTAEYRFSSNYGHFPRATTKNGKENYHGIPLGFSSTSAIQALLEAINMTVIESSQA